ncbi:MAG: 2,3-bisphosphoglycerate-dependent phosphoglycerate mutase [Chlamydiae bacterium]|nr:2,3-bisphosphoglycerate-dependent phosphoglycerate mutase [Chlamydiota bacterium]
MKRVVLVRHAKPESAAFTNDSERPLSDEGRQVHEKISHELRQQNIVPTKIITSPLLRARQTAEIMSKVFDGVPIQESAILDGTHSVDEIVETIADMEHGESIFLVGHDPNMTQFVNKLGSEKVTEGVHKSGCVVFDFPDEISFGKGQYVGYIHP